MDLDLAIRTAVFGAIDGNVIYNAVAVPVYDAFALPPNVAYPYILLSSQTQGQRSTKGIRPFDATLQIDVVTGMLQPEGREQSELIMDQVNTIINPDTRAQINTSVNGWVIGDTTKQSSFSITSKNEMYYIYRKLATYVFIASKN